MNVLFLNSTKKQCGVYQYGKRLYDILKKTDSIVYIYAEISTIDEYNNFIKNDIFNVIIYNYHVLTMPWLNASNIQKKIKNICIPHESSYSFFDIICDSDPTIIDKETLFGIPRPIYENIEDILLNYKPSLNSIHDFINYRETDTPIFGSFGFGFSNKGFHKIVKLINDIYDKAIIKFVIPVADFDSSNMYTNLNMANACKNENTKPNIKLMISHEFFTTNDLLSFLNSNTMNIFLYDKMDGRGISSTIDYALSVKKPLAISDSFMFRHIYSDKICLYKTSIIDCLKNSVEYCNEFREKYSHLNTITKFKNIILPPITYISGGMFGDFIQQLSVINEMYYKTRRKGILYIASIGDSFRFGIEKTYADTFDIIKAQDYIEDYRIYNGEKYDINLSSWRYGSVVYKFNWYNIFKDAYDIEWGTHSWLSSTIDKEWNDKIIINITSRRVPNNLNYSILESQNQNNVIFVSSDIDDYNYFIQITKLNIQWHNPTTFTELCKIIASCKLFIGGLSVPLAIAHALNAPRVIGLPITLGDINHNSNFEKIWKNVYYSIEDAIK